MAIYKLDPAEIGAPLRAELLVVMPVYNEQANMRTVLEEWSLELAKHTERFTFVVVNDGSKDDTQKLLEQCEREDPERYVIVRKPNSGHGNSCRVGYEIACASGCEWVFQIDSDGQCDPKYFGNFWEQRNKADCVFGIRKSRDDGWARVLTSQICRWGSSLVCGVDLRDPNVPYRLIRKCALARALKFIPSGFNIHNVAITFVLKKTPELKFQHVPIHFRDRQGGSNSINLLNVVQWGFDMILELIKLNGKLRTSKRTP